MKQLLLLDAYALIYRAYYAFINRPMRNSKGQNTSAIYGFIKSLLDAKQQFAPTHWAVGFDLSAPTFRSELYPAYKAQREATPEDIRFAVPIIKDILRAMRIPIAEMQGFEADDVIGALATQANPSEFEVTIITPDKDYAQLLAPNIRIAKPARSGKQAEIITDQSFCEAHQLKSPKQFIDVLALWGDTADNIKGVDKVGEKTAMRLIAQYGNIDNLLSHTHRLTPALKQNLDRSHDLLALNRQLVTIRTDIELPLSTADLSVAEPDNEQLTKIFDELEFRSLMVEMGLKKAAPTPGLLDFGEPIATATNMATATLDTVETLKPDYRTAQTEQELQHLAQILSQCTEFAFDTETSGIDPFTSELVGLSLSTKVGSAWWIPLPSNREQAIKMLEHLRPAFENERIAKVGQNTKFDIKMLAQYGLNVRGHIADTMLAHYLLYPDSRHNLDIMAQDILNYKTISINELIGKPDKSGLSMRNVPADRICTYACEDAEIALRLKQVLFAELQQQNLLTLYNTIEEPLIDVLADMELTGVCINTNSLHEFKQTLTDQLLKLESEIRTMANEPTLNISSPKQLGEVLFEKIKIATDNKTKKTKSNQYSTSEEELLKYIDAHPIVQLILDYRSAKKLLSSYVDTLPELVNPKTGRIHTSFNQAVASTGRLSSNNPNLQNIPIREANGREIRRAFIPSSPDYVLLSADYSQIELRLMAHLSGDPHLIEAFQNGADIHAATASKIFKTPLKEVTREQRSRAKTANFGMIYGISAFGLSQRMSISRTDAKTLIDNYFETYQGVKRYMDESVQRAREQRAVFTMFGRRKALPDIASSNGTVRGVAERNAINAPIQGSAADIIKLAMIRIHTEMKRLGLQSKMIVQVHDELVFDVLRSELDTMQRLVKQGMEQAVKLSIPLEVEMGIGQTWLEAH